MSAAARNICFSSLEPQSAAMISLPINTNPFFYTQAAQSSAAQKRDDFVGAAPEFMDTNKQISIWVENSHFTNNNPSN